MTERELFDIYRLDVYRTCYYMLKNQQDAEDICHEVFIKILQKDFNAIEKLKPWILSITMNECRNFIKKHSKVTFLQDLQAWTTTLISSEKTEQVIEEKEDSERLKDMIHTLKPKIQEVIVLKYLHLMKNEEIAHVLNIPIGTVKSRANKGILQLRAVIQSSSIIEFHEEVVK